MTGKRYIARNWGIIETPFNGEPRRNYIWEHFKTISRITDLLNKLHIQNCELLNQLNKNSKKLNELYGKNKELKEEIKLLKMEIAELRESEKDNYNITDGLW